MCFLVVPKYEIYLWVIVMGKKTLGILGGMGPIATASFFHDVLKNTEVSKDSDYLRIIIDSNIDIPSRTRCVLYGEESPVKYMRESCFGLMSLGCEVIAVPCNSAHYFFDDVVFGTNIPWVNMIDVVSNKLKKFNEVLVLGGYVTVVKKLYNKHLCNTVYLDDNSIVYKCIEGVKSGTIDYDEISQLRTVIKNSGAECVLLGCTELPIALRGVNLDRVVVDGNEVYARELVNICGGWVKHDKHS